MSVQLLALGLVNSLQWSLYLLLTRHVVSGARLDAWAYTLVQLLTAGLVLLWLDFGQGSLMGANAAGKSLVTFEGFKIYGGQVHAVEAVFKSMPLNSPTGWDEPQR